MYVRVVSAPKPDYWYSKYIGHVFETDTRTIRPDSIHKFRKYAYNQENYPELCEGYPHGEPILVGGDIIRVEIGSEQNNQSMSQLLKKGDF